MHIIISLIYSIELAMDNNLFVSGIFIDLQEAFDTIDHCFKNFPIRDLVNSLFSSYLSNRRQFVTINGFNSETQSFRY